MNPERNRASEIQIARWLRLGPDPQRGRASGPPHRPPSSVRGSTMGHTRGRRDVRDSAGRLEAITYSPVPAARSRPTRQPHSSARRARSGSAGRQGQRRLACEAGASARANRYRWPRPAGEDSALRGPRPPGNTGSTWLQIPRSGLIEPRRQCPRLTTGGPTPGPQQRDRAGCGSHGLSLFSALHVPDRSMAWPTEPIAGEYRRFSGSGTNRRMDPSIWEGMESRACPPSQGLLWVSRLYDSARVDAHASSRPGASPPASQTRRSVGAVQSGRKKKGLVADGCDLPIATIKRILDRVSSLQNRPASSCLGRPWPA